MNKNALIERGPKSSGMGRPPPIIRAMPERKRFFPVDPFPKGIVLLFLQGKNAQDRPESPQNGYLAKFGRKMIDEIMKSTPWRPYLGNV